MKVGTRLSLGFGVVIALLAAVAIVGVSNISTLEREVEDMAEDKFPKTVWANNVIDNINRIARSMRDVVIFDDPRQQAAELKAIENARQAIQENFDKLEETILLPEGKEALSEALQARSDYVALQERFLQLAQDRQLTEARELLANEIAASGDKYLAEVTDLIDFQAALMEQSGEDAADAAASAIIQMIVLGVIAILAGVIIGIWITRSLTRQLGGEPDYAAARVHEIASGNLDKQIVLRPGDTTSLLASLSHMQLNLRAIVNDIKEIVGKATEGDFSMRIDVSAKQGFGKEIGEGLNQLAEITDVGLNDVTRVSNALADGDLSQTITKEYPGVFGQTKKGVNGTVASLSEIVDEIRKIVDAATQGDFSSRLELAGKKGFAKDIAELLNQLAETTDVGLRDVMRVSKALSKGDLTQTITKDYPGLFGETKQAVNDTVTNLQALVGDIKAAVDTIGTASNEIATGNQDLSQRTEEQASSLEETASSMEEFTGSVKQNAENAQQASQLAGSASEVASKGGEVVRASVTTMAEISESSNKIAEIISVIDGIAFQTNILALNAAVEAARAGEQGRGFAVVAGEVRNLAQRSANAAKEIKTLITDSVSKIESGTTQVNEAGTRMEEIVTSIKRVNDIMAEISAASTEQSSGIEQVNQAIAQMDEVTQQNAALVEEAAAAAESLEEQAQGLARSVSVFKLDTTSSSLAMAPRKAPAKPPAQAKAPSAQRPAKNPSEDEWEEF
ncbi:MAG: methyl-accepting chemotaxis protein [Halothiobacillaceae bacterium]